MSSKYDTDVDLADENNSHTLMVQLIGSNRDVLDVGCASGYLGRVLKARGCTVAGLELDPVAADEARTILDQVVVGSAEDVDLVETFGASRFDVVVFGDVLEHLRDPLPVLRQARRVLKPNGYVVASIPNIAHGSVRLALLRGEFSYRDLGLLDTTHLRFFTRQTIEELIGAAGLAITDLRRTTAGLFATELGIHPGEFPATVVRSIEADPEATTYQFVLKAVVDDAAYSVQKLRDELAARSAEIAQLSADLAAARRGAFAASQADGDLAVGAVGGSDDPSPEGLRSVRVGIAGAFELDDLRTALDLRIVRAELARRLPSGEVRVFSPAGYLRPSRHVTGEVIEPLAPWTRPRADALAEELDAIVVTGRVTGARSLQAQYPDDPADATAAAVLSDGLGEELEAKCPVVWAGVALEPDDQELPVIAKMLTRRRRPGSVIGDSTLVALQEAGTGPVDIVSDPVFLLSRLFTPDVLARRLDYLRALRWFPASAGAVLLQGGADLVPFAGAIATAMRDLLTSDPTLVVVTLDLPCAGGSVFADALRQALPESTARIPVDATIEDIAAAVAASRGVIASSPLLLTMALAYERHHLPVDLSASGALAGFGRSSGNTDGIIGDAAAIAPAFRAAPPPSHYRAILAGIHGGIDRHFDELARFIDEVARARRGRDVVPTIPSPYVRALESAHQALQQRLVAERALVVRQAAADEGDDLPRHHLWRAEKELESTSRELAAVKAELDALYRTKVFRTLQPARKAYGRLRGLRG